MILGLLSDTHGHRAFTRAAMDVLQRERVEAVLHAGDIGSESILHDLMERFGLTGVPVYAVLGNVDLHQPNLAGSAGGVDVRRAYPLLELGGWRIGIAHGDDAHALARMEQDPRLDLVVTGHTHVAEDRVGARPRVINPGAVYRATVPSVAVVDTSTGEARVLPLPRGPA